MVNSAEAQRDVWGQLASLRLPALEGATVLVLDPGGLVTEFASWAGAAKVVDVDVELVTSPAEPGQPSTALSRLRLDRLPDNLWDVVVVGAALSLLQDPASAVADLAARLTPRGVLVLETAVLGQGNDFVSFVNPRGVLETLPEANAVRSLCAAHGLSFRRVGPSVGPEDGPPRLVYHLGNPSRDVWLLLEESSSGKSTKARMLMHLPGAELISGDWEAVQIIQDPSLVSPELASAFAGVTSETLDQAYEAILERQLESEFVGHLLRELAPGATPIVDVFIPRWGHRQIVEAVAAQGYNPVLVSWAHPIQLLSPLDDDRRLSLFRQWTRREHGPLAVDPFWDVSLAQAMLALEQVKAERDALRHELDRRGGPEIDTPTA